MTPKTICARFWSDDFDMDLLKVFPGIEAKLRTPNVTLWTVGHETFGRLNHPCTWNGPHGALLWLDKPNLERDEHGWFNVGAYVANEPEIECTWLEYLRDAWAHQYSALILPIGIGLPPMEWGPFSQIMYALRGWETLVYPASLEASRAAGLAWVMRCDRIFTTAREKRGLS